MRALRARQLAQPVHESFEAPGVAHDVAEQALLLGLRQPAFAHVSRILQELGGALDGGER